MSQQRLATLCDDVSRYLDHASRWTQSEIDWRYVANDISCMVALASAGNDYSRYKEYAGNGEERHAAATAQIVAALEGRREPSPIVKTLMGI
jgi:hypothetical protein